MERRAFHVILLSTLAGVLILSWKLWFSGVIKPSERTLASVTGCKLQGNDARPKAKIALNPTGPFGWEQLP
ncbi:Uncharacterized protein APZ42_019099 [Daphnia magna]|uniref:Uncharacterized protein n=1 Tax=Daphnia magna TaxID=35525 RepID=A0A162CPG1_9CRUS|nr:Uncharacterized protein APZ42_019099 [Daphnia magna]